MKKLTLLILLLQICTATAVMAQLEGRRFLSGGIGLDFANTNPDLTESTNNYNGNVNIGIGKFKTQTKAVGWNLSGYLGGGKTLRYVNGQDESQSGINQYGIGAGRFWQFYKHFNEKIGIYAGPNVNLSYNYKKERLMEQENINDRKSHATTLSLGVGAGVYYRLSERWWLDASLGFATPFSLAYTKINNDYVGSTVTSKASQINYNLSPSFTFPSVGLGLRYFLAN
ncbi:outer membrane beta-barrel protein [Dyadobacter psychrophilus]|uniref:Outer membrane protein beta-barrel domain-containing protein n=1 Tax=Dyadobacter psychrophilus TaxID=651661 RepID=A0A1T5C9R8_9BACT|nr:outer membrane beta-barrel protein [Dyadobacter psychrophilus]SKB56106.1 Outer membrane protein beta-barrel domain-containing protein [Dyadobacter psychrophilus]